MRSITFAMVLCGALSVWAAPPAAALRIGSVAGCVQGADQAMIGVPILSFSLGGEQGTRVTIGDLKVVKAMDECSVRLFRVFALGQHIQSAELRVYDANKVETIRLILTDVLVSAISYTPGQEGISINAAKFEFLHVPSGARSCYDLKTMTAC